MRLHERRANGPGSPPRLAALVLAGLVVSPCTGQSQVADSGAARSVTVSWSYATALVADVAGGTRSGSVVLGAGGVQLAFVPRPLLGWHGARAFVFVMGTHGGRPDALVGDIQGVNNLQAPPGVRLEEAWLQQNFLRNRLSLLVGRYDLNTEFYRLQSAGIFANSAFGMGPELAQSGVAGPSTFPSTAAGARVAMKPSPNMVVRVAVLDGVPVDRPDGGIHLFAPGDGALLAGEVAILARPNADDEPRYRRFQIGRGLTRSYAGKIAVGGWYYTASSPDLYDTRTDGTPALHRGSRGAYLIGDRSVWRDAADSSRVLAVFGQAGLGDGRVDQVGGYLGGGLTLTAPIRRRDHDQIGIAIASAQIGAQAHRQAAADGMPATNETVIALAYFLQVAESVAIQPDLQYVIRPAGTSALRDALVPSLRLSISR
jgi:porin